jgi:hypothetical protein
VSFCPYCLSLSVILNPATSNHLTLTLSFLFAYRHYSSSTPPILFVYPSLSPSLPLSFPSQSFLTALYPTPTNISGQHIPHLYSSFNHITLTSASYPYRTYNPHINRIRLTGQTQRETVFHRTERERLSGPYDNDHDDASVNRYERSSARTVQWSTLHSRAQKEFISVCSSYAISNVFLSFCLSLFLPALLTRTSSLSSLSLTLSLSPSLFFLFFSFFSPSDESCQRSVRSHFSSAQSVRSNAPSNVSTSLNVQLYSMVVLHSIATSSLS